MSDKFLWTVEILKDIDNWDTNIPNKNQNDDEGYTPLCFAALNGLQVYIIIKLAKRGANTSKICNKGKSPLQSACMSGAEEAVRALVGENFVETDNNGDPIYKTDSHGNYIPVTDSHGDIVYELDAAGNKIPLRDENDDVVYARNTTTGVYIPIEASGEYSENIAQYQLDKDGNVYPPSDITYKIFYKYDDDSRTEHSPMRDSDGNQIKQCDAYGNEIHKKDESGKDIRNQYEYIWDYEYLPEYLPKYEYFNDEYHIINSASISNLDVCDSAKLKTSTILEILLNTKLGDGTADLSEYKDRDLCTPLYHATATQCYESLRVILNKSNDKAKAILEPNGLDTREIKWLKLGDALQDYYIRVDDTDYTEDNPSPEVIKDTVIFYGEPNSNEKEDISKNTSIVVDSTIREGTPAPKSSYELAIENNDIGALEIFTYYLSADDIVTLNRDMFLRLVDALYDDSESLFESTVVHIYDKLYSEMPDDSSLNYNIKRDYAKILISKFKDSDTEIRPFIQLVNNYYNENKLQVFIDTRSYSILNSLYTNDKLSANNINTIKLAATGDQATRKLEPATENPDHKNLIYELWPSLEDLIQYRQYGSINYKYRDEDNTWSDSELNTIFEAVCSGDLDITKLDKNMAISFANRLDYDSFVELVSSLDDSDVYMLYSDLYENYYSSDNFRLLYIIDNYHENLDFRSVILDTYVVSKFEVFVGDTIYSDIIKLLSDNNKLSSSNKQLVISKVNTGYLDPGNIYLQDIQWLKPWQVSILIMYEYYDALNYMHSHDELSESDLNAIVAAVNNGDLDSSELDDWPWHGGDVPAVLGKLAFTTSSFAVSAGEDAIAYVRELYPDIKVNYPIIYSDFNKP